MLYKEFTKNIFGVNESIRSYGHLIQDINGQIFVDKEETERFFS